MLAAGKPSLLHNAAEVLTLRSSGMMSRHTGEPPWLLADEIVVPLLRDYNRVTENSHVCPG